MRIAIVHDYLHQFGGAEKVVEKWLEMYPNADVYTSFYTPEKFKSSEIFNKANAENRIHTTWIQSFMPRIPKYFKHFFWLYPLVMSTVTIKNYDAVLISSSYCAKNVKIVNCPKIIHYCHSPSRFLHSMTGETDLNTVSPLFRKVIPVFTFWLKRMDVKAAHYLNSLNTIWVANSNYIKAVLHQVYNCNPIVIYPPVDLNKFGNIEKHTDQKDYFYFYFGRISFHKKVQISIQACLELRRKLIITGSASFQPELDKLKQIIIDFEETNPDAKNLIQILGRLEDEELKDYIAKCQAYVFPGKEDFGITQIEILSSGTPIIAYQEGGAKEYMKNGINGITFENQTVESLKAAILEFEASENWNQELIKNSVVNFSEVVFEKEFDKLVQN